MKKIFLIAYSKENLGDDLFIDILVDKYPEIEFYTRAIQERSYIYNKHDNLYYRNYNIEELITQPIEEFDAIVYIGGSIFMEHAGGVERIKKLNEIAKRCQKNNMPFFFISSNFGPYTTEEYKKEVERLFQNITDICFRDKASYDEFKHIKTVRYAPDVVVSYDKKYSKQADTVGISVINFKYRKDLMYIENNYYEVIKNSIKKYIEQGKEVTLFSFCEYEGDEDTINTIISGFPGSQIKIEKYRGNIDEFIEKYASMEYCLCSRFHAMILSAVYRQNAVVLSYSEKINNVIEDLGLNSEYVKIQDLKGDEYIDLKQFKKLSIDDSTKKYVIEQFKELEKAIYK